MAAPYALLVQDSHRSDSAFEFKWNGRMCRGNELHDAVLSSDLEKVRRLLDKTGTLISSRFHYETRTPKGAVQEGSGEAIHLAVSRGEVEISRLLVERGASLTSMVTRGGEGHYDVLHASIFAEGRGGTEEMVSALLEMKAPLAKNLNGEYPLHKAFQTGKVSLICLLRDERERRGLPDLEDVEPDHSVPTPLELGVNMGKMTEDELAEVAPLLPQALHVFSNHEPRCIPAWLKRCSEVKASDLAKHVTVDELVKVLHDAPLSGDALLTALTDVPDVASVGWHALPTRVSFAPRNLAEKIQACLSPQKTLLHFYRVDNTWAYDTQSFKAPEWHTPLMDRTPGRPIRDVSIQICHVPDLCCPEFFLQLSDSLGYDDLFVFDNVTVRGLLAYIWNKAALRQTILSLLMSSWILALQFIEMSMTLEVIEAEAEAEPRLLRHGGSTIKHKTAVSTTLGEIPIVTTFICARGIVDLVAEIVLFIGYAKIGEWRSYLSLNNLVALLQAIVSISLLFNASSVMYVILVLTYWASALYSVELISENIARAMLPITEIFYSLGPTATLTITGYVAFTHAFFIMKGGMQSPADLLMESFATLFTGALPSSEDVGTGELVLTVFAVVFFLVFILNIFIGVISEQYALAKDRVPQRYQQVIASECFRFLLRAKCIPNVPCLHRVVWPLSFLCVVAMAVIQAMGLLSEAPVKGSMQATIICIAALHFLSYQFEEAPWTKKAGSGEKHYIWMVTPKEEDPEPAPEIIRLQEQIQDIKAHLDQAVPRPVKEEAEPERVERHASFQAPPK
eukprot:TRINITY_DN47184_c0_g1_i1.p1 TRINITY_DN47184_c0_g1~~TRINITY_DN47184_c0_g1_i1.p1  ORF type:complete len:794 (+),score=140.42 TRINITY_DN47184_c0_g1_i1:150-2531(+)